MGSTRKKRAKQPINRQAIPWWWSRLITHVRPTILGYLPIIAIFLVARVALAEAYVIPSGSMEPTLQVGDRLFVNKLRLGPHIPFTAVSLPGYAQPKRYDIAVFVSPVQVDQPEDPTPTLVKRIVGLPGDTLFMRNARLFVNGEEQKQGYGDKSPRGDPDEVSGLFDWQKQYELKQSRFPAAPDQPTHDNWGPIVIPAKPGCSGWTTGSCSLAAAFTSSVIRTISRPSSGVRRSPNWAASAMA